MEVKRENSLIILRSLLLLFIEAAVLVLVIQKLHVGNTDTALIWAIQHKKIFFVTTGALALIGIFFDALFGRFWIANSIVLTFGVVFAFVNQQKMAARNAPLLPSDLLFIKEPGEMMKMANQKSLITILVGLVLLVVITFLLEKFLPIKWSKLKRFWLIRAVILVCTIFIFSGVFKITQPNTMANRFSNWMENKQDFWNPASTASQDGPLLTFVNFMGSKIMKKPSGYNQQTMKKIAQKYEKEAQSINKSRPKKDINKQTLIYVLSESFADPQRVPNLQVNQDPVPEVNAIKQKTTSGLMLSSGYGGGTADIEYGAKTSWNLQFFDPSMTTPFAQLVPKKDYNPNVADLFKRKNAIHPYLGTFYGRRDAYKKFGFQTFRSTDGQGKNETLKYKKKIQRSTLVGDDQAYKNVYWQLNHEKRGQFINLITMQNHFAYGNKYDQYPHVASGPAITDQKNADEIKYYMEGISLTSKYTQQFLDQLDKYQRPITLVWYGDHLPGIYSGVDMNKNYIRLHESDYFIYSNRYARQHGYSFGKQKDGVQVVSPNTFTALALKQMNQKVNPFYALMTEVQAKLPAQNLGNSSDQNGLMVDENSQQVLSKSLSKEQKSLLRDYKLVQYDNTAGKHYLKDLHFMK